MEDFIEEEVVFRINNDLDYLMETCNCKSDFFTIEFLKNLTDEDVKVIVEKVCNDNELKAKIDEIIEWYVYHYQRESEVE